MTVIPKETLRPPYDPEILTIEDTQFRPVPSSTQELIALRTEEEQVDPSIADDPSLDIQKRNVPGPRGDIKTLIVRAKGSSGDQMDTPAPPLPCILFLHGGGRVMGNPYVGLSSVVQAAREDTAVIVCPAYALAPEHGGDAAAEDCYATLLWLQQHDAELGVDRDRLVLAGASAGGGLAAATAMMARDRGGPRVLAQLLACPMLDDRCTTLSNRQFNNGPRGYYTRWGHFAWRCVLGDAAGTDATVSCYAAPGRAEDLSGLPPAYIDVGSAEPFRDEAVAFARGLWEAGVQADLHIWGGGSHGFDMFLPSTWLGRQAVKVREAWLRRVLTTRG